MTCVNYTLRSIPYPCPCSMWLPCGVLERIWEPRGKCRNMGCWCHQLHTISEALYKYVASAINVGYATYVWGMPVPRPDTQETAHCLQKIPGVHWREYQPLETNNSQNKISIKCVLNLAITRLCKATSEGFPYIPNLLGCHICSTTSLVPRPHLAHILLPV